MFFYFLFILSVIHFFIECDVMCSPLRFLHQHDLDETTISYDSFETSERSLNSNVKLYTTNDKIFLEQPFPVNRLAEESFEKFLIGNSESNIYGNQQIAKVRTERSAKDISNNNIDMEKDSENERLDTNEARASTIPFLSKGDSASGGDSSGGGGLPSVPGLSQIPGVSNVMDGASKAGSNTPTAVIGGFSLIIMPMPGLTMANMGSALQAGQQMSQLVPGMPTLPG